MATLALGQAIEGLATDFGLTDGQLGGALGVNPRTIARWRSEERYPQHEARRRLAALLALRDRLGETFDGPEAVAAWLHGNSAYLRGIKPVEALAAGRIDAVEAALEALDSGVFV